MVRLRNVTLFLHIVVTTVDSYTATHWPVIVNATKFSQLYLIVITITSKTEVCCIEFHLINGKNVKNAVT